MFVRNIDKRLENNKIYTCWTTAEVYQSSKNYWHDIDLIMYLYCSGISNINNSTILVHDNYKSTTEQNDTKQNKTKIHATTNHFSAYFK